MGWRLHRMWRRREAILSAGVALVACGSPTSRLSAGPVARARPLPDLYACEGCEGVFEADAARLSHTTRMAPEGEPGEPMRIEGRVLAADGRTPVADVVLYAYQTDATGLYSRGRPDTVWSRRHGLLRGWVRTGPDGAYAFDTIKPAPYPNDVLPAHVHFTVLEPGRRPYWIDDIVFAGEFGVDESYRRARENRGGDGIVTLERRGAVWLARRDVRLEPHPGG